MSLDLRKGNVWLINSHGFLTPWRANHLLAHKIPATLPQET
jgi:hypothetical protein